MVRWYCVTEQQNKFCLSVYNIGVNSVIFLNGVEIYKLKANNSEINGASICLGNVAKDFSVDNMKRLDDMNMSLIFQNFVIVLKLIIF